MKYLRTNRLQRLPRDFHVVRRFRVERLDLEKVESITAETVDVTTLSSGSTWREHAVTGFYVLMKDGTSRRLSPEEMKLSETGGEFFEVAENGLHRYPLTEFCHRLELARERRAEAMQTYWDTWY